MSSIPIEDSVRKKYRELTLLLIEKALTITTMESATGGQLASLLTDTEGSSAVLKGAFVTYCNEAKILQGVPASVIDTYTVYSEETASAMAEACRKTYDAKIGIGVTGTFGNTDPANPEASVPGEVYYAICCALPDHSVRTVSRHATLPQQPSRLAYKLLIADRIANDVFACIAASF